MFVMAFSLDSFLSNPSYNGLIHCRKDELAQIAGHCSLTYPKPILKKDLRILGLGKLVEQRLITLPVTSKPSELESTIGEEGSYEQRKTPPDKEESKKVDEWPKIPLTLPKYDPLSSASTESMHEARLKVHLECLV